MKKVRSQAAEGKMSSKSKQRDRVRVSVFRWGEDLYSVMSFGASSTRTAAELTKAERLVLAGLIHGRSTQEIARSRRASERTVENQVASIYRKLNVRSRSELIATLSFLS